ncbi:YhcN/YlaJ family sporulation lipoprotein [Virgibacillus phasianinus]|nr:YhcN/YlaJ family sporulation lipoprotein [Virgibacillus phasianinus]
MRLRYGCLLFAVLIAGGCANGGNNEASDDDQIQSQPLHYETKHEQNERLDTGDQPQTQTEIEKGNVNRGDNTSGNNTDVFTNEQSKEIADYLMKRRDIKLAQVAITDKKIVVAVMLNDHSNHDITDGIESDVRKFDKNKTIVVYTDDNHWDRMSNLKARLKQSNFSDDLKDDMKRLFNPNR